MEGIEWSRPMAPLLPGLHSPSVSELPSADCQPPSTPMGHSFNPLENRYRKKILKYICLNRILSIKYWDRRIFKILLPKAIFDL